MMAISWRNEQIIFMPKETSLSEDYLLTRKTSITLHRTNLCRCFQSVDVLSLDIIELNKGVPHDGRTCSVSRKSVSLHASHSQQISLGAPLGLNICGGKEDKKTYESWVTGSA